MLQGNIKTLHYIMMSASPEKAKLTVNFPSIYLIGEITENLVKWLHV